MAVSIVCHASGRLEFHHFVDLRVAFDIFKTTAKGLARVSFYHQVKFNDLPRPRWRRTTRETIWGVRLVSLCKFISVFPFNTSDSFIYWYVTEIDRGIRITSGLTARGNIFFAFYFASNRWKKKRRDAFDWNLCESPVESQGNVDSTCIHRLIWTLYDHPIAFSYDMQQNLGYFI